MTREQFRQVKETTRCYFEYPLCFDGFSREGKDNYKKIKVFEEEGYCWTIGFDVSWCGGEPEFDVRLLDFKKDDAGDMYLVSTSYLEVDLEEDEDGHEVAYFWENNLEEVIGWVKN